MKSLLLIVFSLLLFSASALADYQDIMNTNEAILLEEGTLYLQKPFLVYESNPFAIEVVVLLNETGIETDFILSRGDVELTARYEAGDVNDEQSYVLLTWNDNISTNESYELLYRKEGRLLYETEFIVRAQPKIVVEKDIQEQVLRSDPRTDNQRELLIELLSRQDIDYDLVTFKEEEALALETVSYTKKVTTETLYYNDNSTEVRTVVTLVINPDETVSELKIIETIPKEFAFTADLIRFNQEPLILENDPVVMWHLEDLEETTIQYDREGEAVLTGNTILLAQTISETEETEIRGKILWPLLLIPFIAGIVIYFAKRKPE